MRLRAIVFFCLAGSVAVPSVRAGEVGPRAAGKVLREATEWCQISVPAATSVDKPRILLVGDSIVAQYAGAVREELRQKAYCASMATSAAVADPVFLEQLETMFVGCDYAVIQFNNGLHGWGYTEDEYRAAYERAVEWIRKKAPNAKLILALSTPVKPGSPVDALYNPRVDARNAAVRDLAKKLGLAVNDLHAISRDKPDCYADAFHYKRETIQAQAAQVAAAVAGALAENGPVRQAGGA